MINEQRLIALFKELCLIDAPSLKEAQSVRFVRSYLEGLGMEVSEDRAGEKIGGEANNLIARLPATQVGGPRIFLSAHFDTVEPTAGLKIREVDGVFSSESETILGADDKAGMAPAIEAVHALIESHEPHCEVLLLLSVAEEIGLKGAAALEIEELDCDFGYVLDTGPPVGSFVNRTASHDKINARIIGKPAHSGKDPEKGISAIEVAAAAISRMKLGRLGPELTANVGILRAGTAVNVVCPRAELFAEARGTDKEELRAQVDHMIGELERAARERGARVEVDYERHYESYFVEETSPVAQVAIAASKSIGLEPTMRTTLGGSDANIYNAKGVPTLVVATGMEHIHTHDESVSRASLVQNAELCLRLVREASKLSGPNNLGERPSGA